MYCPNCGTETSADRKFCRVCGIGLEPFSQILTGRLPTVPPGNMPVETAGPIQSERRKVMRWGFITMWGGLVLAALLGILGGALVPLLDNVGVAIASLAGLGGLVFMVGIGIIIYSFFLPKAPAQFQQNNQTRLPGSQPPLNLQQDFDRKPFPSVTDHTTQLFDSTDPDVRARNAPRQDQ